PADRAVNDSRFGIHPSPYQTEVLLGYAAVHELPRQLSKGDRVLRNDHNAGGILVQTMNDAGPPLAADTFYIGTMMQKRVHQCALGSPRRRMDNNPSRLVDNDTICVLIEYIQRQRFWLQRARPGRQLLNLYQIIGSYPCAWLYPVAVESHFAFADEPLYFGTAEFGWGRFMQKMARKKQVQTHARFRAIHKHLLERHGNVNGSTQ